MQRKNWANTLGMIFLLGLALSALAWWRAPKAEFAPPPGGTLLPTSPIVIRFNSDMQPQDVAAHLGLTPEHPVQLAWEDARTLHITPQTSWPAGENLSITLQRGIAAQTWPHLRSHTTYRWQVAVSAPTLLYLWPARGAPANLYRLHLETGESEQLTDLPLGITGYTASADGRWIYYTDTQGDIYRLNRLSAASTLLVDCGEDVCSAPALSPDGKYLAWERTPTQGTPQTALPRVWYLPLEETAAPQPIPAPDTYSRQPQWNSANWLSVYLPNQAQYFTWQPESGQTRTWTNDTGEPGTWLPDASAFIAPAITLLPNGYMTSGGDFLDLPTSHLIRYALEETPPTDLSETIAVEDTTPVISPNGRLLAFARKFLAPDQWTPGRQVWLLTLDTGSAVPLTNAPLYNHTAFAWNPTGNALVYLRANQDDFSQPPELWLAYVDGRQPPLRLVVNAFAPQWIP